MVEGRVEVFARQWNRFVSPGEGVYAYEKWGETLLAAERERSAFGLVCQPRTMTLAHDDARARYRCAILEVGGNGTRSPSKHLRRPG